MATEFKILLYMKKVMLVAVLVASAICCAEKAHAQHGRWDKEWYVSLSGGIVSVSEAITSPAASLRFGSDFGIFFGDVEASYLSLKSYNLGYDDRDFSTVTLGVNAYVKFLEGEKGQLAAGACLGFSLQDDQERRGPHHDSSGGYIGFSLNGMVNLNEKVGLFAEARYQSLPFERFHHDRTQWGIVAQGGLRFYF